MNDKLLVNEIFYSIDGEGKQSGCPAIFIRLTGCNLRCKYCDTVYAFQEGKYMSISEILAAIRHFNCKHITLTGGEPLAQKNAVKLLKTLKVNKYKVTIETNGAIDITNAQRYSVICMDWKTPASGMCEYMKSENLKKLRKKDVLKIVMSENDIPYVREFLRTNKIHCPIYLSPIFGKIDLPQLAEFVKENQNTRMQLQIHKYIWDINKRGV